MNPEYSRDIQEHIALSLERGDPERHLWLEILSDRRVCNPSDVPLDGLVRELEVERWQERREDDLCEAKRFVEVQRTYHADRNGTRTHLELRELEATIIFRSERCSYSRSSVGTHMHARAPPMNVILRPHQPPPFHMSRLVCEYSQVRVYPGNVRLLERARKRVHPALRLPRVLRARAPELRVVVAGVDVRDDVHALLDRDRVDHRAVDSEDWG